LRPYYRVQYINLLCGFWGLLLQTIDSGCGISDGISGVKRLGTDDTAIWPDALALTAKAMIAFKSLKVFSIFWSCSNYFRDHWRTNTELLVGLFEGGASKEHRSKIRAPSHQICGDVAASKSTEETFINQEWI